MNWIPIINNEELKNEIENKLLEIYNSITEFKVQESYGLLSGYSGVFLFLYYYYLHTKKKEILDFLNTKFIDFYSNFSKKPYGSFSNGYSGICWLIRFLSKNGIVDSEDIDENLFDLDLATSYFLQEDIQKKNYDFLHGGLGIGYYFSTLDKSSLFYKQNSQLLDCLYKNKVVTKSGSYKWLFETYMNYERIGFTYNLSLSHGMAAIVHYLFKINKSSDNELAFDMLKKLLLFYKESINPSNFLSTFPKWFEENTIIQTESPLSWCYGDPGIAQSILNASEFVNDDELYNISLNALIKTTYRTDNLYESVNEACICHGTSSLSHIYNRLYQKTNLNIFKESSIYWLKKSLLKGHEESEYAGYIFFKNNDITSNINLLSGLTGVGLSLLATIDCNEPIWDECLLLS